MIRQAEAMDKRDIERLYKILISESDHINVLETHIEQIKEDPNNFLYVWDQQGQVIGTSMLHILPDPMFAARPYALIENVIVDPGYQGQGIGKQLMQHIEEQCIKANCTVMMLLSHSSRVEAHRFYENIGFNGSISKGFKKSL
jgi:GNAT superfamily N-acetyltransferase